MMADLSTDNLTYLLDHSTPGPWTFTKEITDMPSRTEAIGHVVYKKGNELEDCLFGIWDDPVTDKYPTNLPLAAASTELAHEVIRLRQELRSMQQLWLPIATDQNRTPIEQDFAAHLVENIDHILGDHTNNDLILGKE